MFDYFEPDPRRRFRARHFVLICRKCHKRIKRGFYSVGRSRFKKPRYYHSDLVTCARNGWTGFEEYIAKLDADYYLYMDEAREEYEYSYYNSEDEMQDYPERFIFNEDGTWERI